MKTNEPDGRLSRAKDFLSRFREDREAGTMVTTALMLPVLFGFAALAIDGSMMFMHKRQLQTIADSGALHGAHENVANGIPMEADFLSGLVETAAQRNGFDTSTDQLDLAYYDPGAEFSDAANFVEVVVSRELPSILAGFLSNGSLNIQARAVAGGVQVTEASGCIIALDDSASPGVNFGGNQTTTIACGVVSNSSAANAIRIHGNASVGLDSVTAVGGCAEQGRAKFDYWDPSDPDGEVVYNCSAEPTSDPFEDHQSDLPVVDHNNCTYTAHTVQPGVTETLSPGTYCGGLTVKGYATFLPGVYVIEGDLLFTSQSVVNMDQGGVTTAGVTFILTGNDVADIGKLEILGGASINLSAPADGPYQGMLFIQDSRATEDTAGTTKIQGNSDNTLDGAFYFPNSHVRVAGTAGNEYTCTMIVAGTADFTGTSDLYSDQERCEELGLGYATGDGVSITQVQLIE